MGSCGGRKEARILFWHHRDVKQVSYGSTPEERMSDHKPVSAMFLITRATKKEKQKLRKKLSSNSNTFRFRSLSSQASIGDMKAALESEEKGKNSTTETSSPASSPKGGGGGCPLCHKKILMFRLRSTQCDSCKRRFCSKCCPKDNRGNITNDEGDILKKNARFCLQCKPMNLVFM